MAAKGCSGFAPSFYFIPEPRKALISISSMRNFIFIAALSAAIFACSEKEPDQGEVAGRAAKLYYEYLLKGDYKSYVDGFYRPDSIPDSYHRQLVDNAKMFVSLQGESHKGIDSVRFMRAKADTASHTAEVFLMFCYGDSTKEEVVVPMVEHNGTWMMK